MILSELATYLADHRRAALIDLANRFDADPEALRTMLGTLIRKGRARKLPAGTSCAGGCCQCDPATVEVYEWIDAGASRLGNRL